jgi:hypothetical protein
VKEGGALVYRVGYVYAFRGKATTAFWRYNVTAGAWETLAAAPATVFKEGALATDAADAGATDLYAFRGNDQIAFWQYSTLRNTWTTLPNAPEIMQWGGSPTVLKGTLYGQRGKNTAAFWSYDLPELNPAGPRAAPHGALAARALTWRQRCAPSSEARECRGCPLCRGTTGVPPSPQRLRAERVGKQRHAVPGAPGDF